VVIIYAGCNVALLRLRVFVVGFTTMFGVGVCIRVWLRVYFVCVVVWWWGVYGDVGSLPGGVWY